MLPGTKSNRGLITKNFKCDVCGFKFSTDKMISRAVTASHPVNPNKPGKCHGKMIEYVKLVVVE